MNPGRRGATLCVIALTALLVAASDASLGHPVGSSSLQDDVNRIVDEGFEQPERSLSKLRALLMRRGQAAEDRRFIITGIGLVAADSNLDEDARWAIGELEHLAPKPGDIAHADALLVRADMEFGRGQTQASIVDAADAVSAYSRHCEASSGPFVKACNPFNWFWANLFAGVFISERKSHNAATMHLTTARDIAARMKRPDLEARAQAFMAQLAQEDGDPELADRTLHRADALAVESGVGSAQEFVEVFKSNILVDRGDLPGALESLRTARRIASSAGHARRLNDLVKDVAALELKLGEPQQALLEIEQIFPDLERRHVVYSREVLATERIVALLQLKRTGDAQRLLPELLDSLDAKTGPVERSEYVNELGDALVGAGLADEASALFEREREAISAGADRHFERLMLDRQTRLQSGQLVERGRETRMWSSIAVATILLSLIAVLIVPMQRLRNRRLRETNEALRKQSERDPLTGLLNRDGLLRELKMHERWETFIGTVLLVDIDHFKSVNDSLGHAGGDVVLREVARRLQSCLREGDLVVRWGGEELVVVVLSVPFDADALVDRIMHSIATIPVRFQEREIAVSASIGYGTFPLAGLEGKISFDESLAVADAGMYYAKRHGRCAAVRIVTLPLGLLGDLGGLPSAVETGALQGSVCLTVRRIAARSSSTAISSTADHPPRLSEAPQS